MAKKFERIFASHSTSEKNIPWFSFAHHRKCYKKRGKLLHCLNYQPSARRTIVPFSEKIVSVNQMLYYFTTNNDLFYASWCNSALYLCSLFQNHQTIHFDFYHMSTPNFDLVKFPIYSKFEESTRTELISKWEQMAALSDEKIPFLPQQFGADKIIKGKKKKGIQQPDIIEHYEPLPERVALDNAWLGALGVPEEQIDVTRKELYAWLIEYMTAQ